ncbi:MAG: hypothetical protein D6B25_10885 [Desulfobulbaceae bacterium]|nr:MAG: hypothetical protein D6B25_10885 [Desulfobulbaceae bacterium]
MLPQRIYELAGAEYHCNVYEFIMQGEGKSLSPRQIGSIKRSYPRVEQWFAALQPGAKARVLRYLYEKQATRERKRRKILSASFDQTTLEYTCT